MLGSFLITFLLFLLAIKIGAGILKMACKDIHRPTIGGICNTRINGQRVSYDGWHRIRPDDKPMINGVIVKPGKAYTVKAGVDWTSVTPVTASAREYPEALKTLHGPESHAKPFDQTPLYCPTRIDFEGCYAAERAVWGHTWVHGGWPEPKSARAETPAVQAIAAAFSVPWPNSVGSEQHGTWTIRSFQDMTVEEYAQFRSKSKLQSGELF